MPAAGRSAASSPRRSPLRFACNGWPGIGRPPRYASWLVLAGWMAVGAGRPSILEASRVFDGRLLGASLFAAMLGAAQFLPTIGTRLHRSVQPGGSGSRALAYSFWPWRLITLITPDFFGNPARGDYWGYANFWEDAVYIGLLPAGAGRGSGGTQPAPEGRGRTSVRLPAGPFAARALFSPWGRTRPSSRSSSNTCRPSISFRRRRGS